MTENTGKPDLKVVGSIAPPEYKTTAKALANILEDLEAGVYGEISSAVLVMRNADGMDTFGFGPNSGIEDIVFLLASAQNSLLRIVHAD